MADNIHASAVVIGDRGVLLSGPSGIGKSALAMSLVMHAQGLGRFGRLVGDDQLLLSVHDGRLFCTAPAAIAGLVEIRGLGPTPVAHVGKAPVDLWVELVGCDAAPRFPETQDGLLAGCRVRRLVLAGSDTEAALRAVVACLGLAPFR
jgi:serine kinase of HPr protein (carbohydrate metabolism regulator)